MKASLAALVVVFAVCVSPAEAAKCSITATPVTFGPYNVFAPAPVDSTGSVRFNCNGGAKNVQISISKGQGPTYFMRAMKKGGEYFGYNLFLDPARTRVWGDGSGVSEACLAGNPPDGQDVTVTIYGRIPSRQDVSFGAYADNVTVTIDF